MRHHQLLALIVPIVLGLGGRVASAKGEKPGPAAGGAPAGSLKTVQRIAPALSFDRLGNADGLPNSNVHVIVQDPLGFLWFGTQDGLARYDGTQMRVYRHDEADPSSISANYITALALDASGKLWVGTDTNGVNLYDPDTDRFTRYVHGGKGTLTSEGATAILRDKKDRIWLAMSGGGLNRFEPGTGTFAEYASDPLDGVITAMHVDAAGALWLGAGSDGVIRYNPDDGSTTSFRPTPSDPSGLGTAPIRSILAASSGVVWIGTDGDGLFSLDPKSRKVTRYRHSTDRSSLSDDHVSVLFEDRHKVLWIGTANGLDRMDAGGKLVQYHHDPNNARSLAFPGVESIYQDAGGVMWIGGFTAGACKFDELRVKFGHHRTRTHSANSYFEDADGTLWVGTYNGGLFKYEHGAQRVTLYHTLGTPGEAGSVALESAWISALRRDKRGTLWIAVKGTGLVAFDSKTESFKTYAPVEETANSLPVDTIWDIHEDDKGVLWLASWGGGLVAFDPALETFKSYVANDTTGLTSNHLYAAYPDPQDRKTLWLGTARGGLVRFNTTAGTGTAFRHKAEDPASLSSDDVTTVHRDAAGALWVGTYGGGLNKLDAATGKATRFTTGNSGLPNNSVFGVLPDNDGKLWLSTNGGGLAQLDLKTGTFLVYDASDGVQDNEFGQGSFMRSKSGKLYFGGPGGFNAFMPRDIVRDTYAPPVVVTGLKLFNQDAKLDRPIWTLPPLELSYSDSFELRFAALSFAAPNKNRYAYKLEGFDDRWIETDRPFATYTKLNGGNYTLRIRAANRHGAWNEAGVALKMAVTPPIWRTWPAFVVYVLLLAGIAALLYRMQRQKVRRIQREGRLAVVERDLELTGAVQSGFLPEESDINGNNMRLLGFYRGADACSGDWWWHETLADGRHVILVGDVTGHGPGPAMVTAAVATAFRVLTGNGLTDVKYGLDLLNRVVLHVAKGKYHMTMAALELDDATGHWVLHSAGAPPILTLDGSGKHKAHFCAGAPLGTEMEFETGRVEGKLEPSERILIYTDGIPEISLPNGNVLGMRKLAQIYERTRTQDIRSAAAAIVQMADQTQSGREQNDDWTFTLIEWTGGQGGQSGHFS